MMKLSFTLLSVALYVAIYWARTAGGGQHVSQETGAFIQTTSSDGYKSHINELHCIMGEVRARERPGGHIQVTLP